jgi:TPP-dependent pyruvate/acetoin dehydrogenase alpha subunit
LENHHRVINSYFANIKKLTGTGTGARVEFDDIEPHFLEMVETKVSEKPIELEYDSTKRNYLHPVEGSEAAEIGAGLFLSPNSQA